jgi:hypothetical protein
MKKSTFFKGLLSTCLVTGLASAFAAPKDAVGNLTGYQSTNSAQTSTFAAGSVGSGLRSSGSVGSGLHSSGSVGSGLRSSGSVGSGLRAAGSVGSG